MISSSPTSILSQSLVGEDEGSEEPWTILPASEKSLRTTNPIRAIVDPIVANLGQQTHDKSFLSLALGDPTASGNLPPCPVALQAVQRALQTTGHAAGYVSACGTPQARKAIARFHHSTSSNNDDHDSSTPVVSPDNVIVASGCSGALELALTALLDEDSVLLVPQPGFPLYQVIAESHGARVVHYRLLPHQNWECDLAHLQSLMRQYGNKNVVRGLVLNNPSNPTGAVFSAAHLRDVLGFCQQHKLPIVADEVYGDLTFAGHEFHPVAQVAADLGRQVPVIAASGLGKQYLVPGWRVGWVVFHDNVHGSLRQVEAGAKRLAQVILGASHLAQTAIPALLDPHNGEIEKWKGQLRQTLQNQATHLCRKLVQAPGLQVLTPGGAMYAMARIDTDVLNFSSDMDFTKKLLEEENVFVLPGSCFGIDHVVRLVFCSPVDVLEEAATRICGFCKRHQKRES